MELGEKIDQRMKELGMTQSSLARASGLSQNYLSQLINGVGGSRVSYKTVVLLRQSLSVGDDFFYDTLSLPGHTPVKRGARY